MKLKLLLESAGHAWNGIKYTFKHEQNFRIQLLFAVVIICLSFFLGIRKSEFIVIFLLIIFVLTLELLNTALERFLDMSRPRLQYQIGVVKDVLAAMVLVASAGSAYIGIMILTPYILQMFF